MWPHAKVVKSVDTQRSGRCARKGMGVRVPPLAPRTFADLSGRPVWKGRIVGLVRRFAKPLSGVSRSVGSNPTPSAQEPLRKRLFFMPCGSQAIRRRLSLATAPDHVSSPVLSSAAATPVDAVSAVPDESMVWRDLDNTRNACSVMAA